MVARTVAFVIVRRVLRLIGLGPVPADARFTAAFDTVFTAAGWRL
jgi:hypothetical protein